MQYIAVPIPANAPAVDRTLLRDDVYGRLRDAIIDGTFAPGEQLRDGELADWLGVSRAPVREARVVVAARHRLAVLDAVPHPTSAHLDAMRNAAASFAAAVEAGEVETALSADDELHGIPVAVAGNRAVASVLEQFTPLLRHAERLRSTEPDAQGSLDRHDELLRLCAAGDAEGAAAVAYGTWSSLPAPE